jgi:hypothetical protein
MGIFCLSGPAAERLFCGAISDDSDRIDIEMCRESLFLSGFNAFAVAAEIARLRTAADRLVRSEQDRIRLIAQALLRHQRLTGEQIFEMLPRQSG